ncbi:MAG: sortase [Candidatus Limivicinus sp.]
MVIGAVLILGALALLLYNRQEAGSAEQASVELLPQLQEEIRQRQEELAQSPTVPPELLDPSYYEMTEVEIDGYAYIGYLSIPTLGLELPVMSQWDYERLKTAPCRYTGSTKSDDLVLLAHNFVRHFGTLKNLTPGDEVYFTDMDDRISCYEVVTVEILPPTAVEEMTAGEYDLTLFTCTYGGQNRVTVRCDRITES